MSVVTNCIFSFSVLEDEPEIADQVNFYFYVFECKPLISCDNTWYVPNGWYGGSKMLETPLYIGAFNCFDVDLFLEHVRKIEFRCPEDVQLMVQEQEESRFTLIDVFEVENDQKNQSEKE